MRQAFLGGYPITLRDGGKAGAFGCDPCTDCGKRPPEGARVFWLSSLLMCKACADRAALPTLPAGWRWTTPRRGLGSEALLYACRSDTWGDHVPDLVSSSLADAARQAQQCAEAGL